MFACPQCDHENPHASRFCEGCGSALQDPRAAEMEADSVEAEFHLDRVRKARGAFVLLGVLQLVAGGLSAMSAPDGMGTIFFAVEATLAAIFFGLAWWCTKQPFAAAMVGLILYGGLHLVATIVDPSTLFQGIVVKVIVIAILVRAVRAGITHRHFMRSRGMG